MILISLLVISVVLFFVGRGICSFKFLKVENKNISFCCILGFLVCLLVGEMLHIGAIFLHLKVDEFIVIYGVSLLFLFLFSVFLLFLRRETLWFELEKIQVRDFFVLSFLLIPLLLLKQPNFEYDIIIEQVSTMLHTNSFWEINPITGIAYEVGVPTRIQILGFPSILAALCQWFFISVDTCLTKLVPIVVLGMTFFVYCQWGLYFWGDDKEKSKRKIYIFMMIVAVLLLLGQAATFTPSYGLFHMGYRPEVIAQNILYPMIILMALKKKYWFLLLGCMVELGLVWTLYGLGMGIFFSVCVISVRFILEIQRKRKVEKC